MSFFLKNYSSKNAMSKTGPALTKVVFKSGQEILLEAQKLFENMIQLGVSTIFYICILSFTDIYLFICFLSTLTYFYPFTIHFNSLVSCLHLFLLNYQFFLPASTCFPEVSCFPSYNSFISTFMKLLLFSMGNFGVMKNMNGCINNISVLYPNQGLVFYQQPCKVSCELVK